jgi:isoleucyl-tRNA synthetase
MTPLGSRHGVSVKESVFLASFPAGEKEGLGAWRDAALEERFAPIWRVRDVVLKALEEARQAKAIGHPREARVILTADTAAEAALRGTSEELSRLFLVSELELKGGSSVAAAVERAPGAKCARCWVHSRKVGTIAAHPDLCDRCSEAVK